MAAVSLLAGCLAAPDDCQLAVVKVKDEDQGGMMKKKDEKRRERYAAGQLRENDDDDDEITQFDILTRRVSCFARAHTSRLPLWPHSTLSHSHLVFVFRTLFLSSLLSSLESISA